MNEEARKLGGIMWVPRDTAGHPCEGGTEEKKLQRPSRFPQYEELCLLPFKSERDMRESSYKRSQNSKCVTPGKPNAFSIQNSW